MDPNDRSNENQYLKDEPSKQIRSYYLWLNLGRIAQVNLYVNDM